jgi:hypothetical protein
MAIGASLRRALTLWRMPSRLTLGIVGVLLLLLIAAWLLAWRTASRLPDSLRWFGTPEYAAVSVGPLGTIEYRDFRLRDPDPRGGDVFSAARLRLETPGLHWLVWHGLSGGPSSGGLADVLGPARRARAEQSGGVPPAFPPAARLRLQAEGLVAGPALAVGDLRWIGLTSGAPLDGEGCDGIGRFTAAHLVEMGLDDVPTQAEASFVVTGRDAARITFAIEQRAASRTELDMQLRLDGVRGLLDADWSRSVILERRWTVRDLGMVSARNRWCAQRMGISRDGYVDRHLGAIKRMLAEVGAAPTRDLESAYRRYAARGGEITWESKPSLTTPVGQLATFALPERLRIMNATLESVRGRAAPFRFEAVPLPVAAAPLEAPPLPGVADASAVATPVPGTAPAATPPAGEALPVPAPPLASVQGPDTAPPIAPPAPPASTPEPAAGGAPVADRSPPAPAPEAAPTPVPARPLATTAPPVVDPIASPREARASDPPVQRAPAPREPGTLARVSPPPPAAGPVRYADLALLEGRRIEVRSVYGSVRRGTLEKYTDTAITLRLEQRERGLSVTMPQQTVDSVRLLDTPYGAGDAPPPG